MLINRAGRAARALSVLWVVCSFALFAFFAPSAEAQDQKVRARTLFNEGVAQFEAGSFREALSSFEQAYRLAPHPAVRVNMANCFEQLGQYVEAVFNYQRFLAESGDAVTPEQETEVELAIARLTPHIGTLLVELDPPEAALTIDGAQPKRLPSGAVQLPEGRYTLRATAPGYDASERSVEVEGGVERRVTMSLAVEGAEPAPVAAQMADDSEPEPSEAPPSHSDSEEAPARSGRPWLWVGVGTTAAFAAGFVVSAALTLKSQSDFDAAVERSNDLALDTASRNAAVAEGNFAADRTSVRAVFTDVFLAGTVVAGGATLLIWLLGKKHARTEQSLNAAPIVRSGGAGLVLRGNF